MGRNFKVYLSHSWHPRDVELNLWVWDHLAGRCDLLVDNPFSQVEKPPYYVSRLEQIMRNSDIFVAILTYRPDAGAAKRNGDHALRCSPGSLFEIRLAERAHLPRLVLYERDTGFQPSSIDWSGAKYIAFDRGTQPLPDTLDQIKSYVEDWLKWVDERRKPRVLEKCNRSVILLPKSADSTTVDQLKAALLKGQFPDAKLIDFQSRTDDLIHNMLNSGLVVADVTSEGTRELYAIAHALFLPAIRLVPDKKSPLPWILDGHPGGYQHDIVALSGGRRWSPQVTARARAIFEVSDPLGLEAGRKYIKSRRYKGVNVFLSHNLRPGKREFLDRLIQSLVDEQIDRFEYYRDNEAGIEWAPALEEALGKATLFVGLLADGYEDSPVCQREWKARNDRDIPLLVYLVNGRTTRTNLTPLHNQTLDSNDPAVNATIVFDRIKGAALKQRS